MTWTCTLNGSYGVNYTLGYWDNRGWLLYTDPETYYGPYGDFEGRVSPVVEIDKSLVTPVTAE